MKKFWSYIENGKYGIGCTGQTVYVYDQNGTELARFKDLPCAYKAAFSPCGNIFAVKTTEGRLAVYSLESLSLIRKFRYSNVVHSQDDGFCFSPDGKYFINIERHTDTMHSAISVYDTSDFAKEPQISFHKNLIPMQIEAANGEYYVFGLLRGSENISYRCFVGKFADCQIKDVRIISKQDGWFYENYFDLKLMGFTEKAYEWSELDTPLEELRKLNDSPEKLWKRQAAFPNEASVY